MPLRPGGSSATPAQALVDSQQERFGIRAAWRGQCGEEFPALAQFELTMPTRLTILEVSLHDGPIRLAELTIH